MSRKRPLQNRSSKGRKPAKKVQPKAKIASEQRTRLDSQIERVPIQSHLDEIETELEIRRPNPPKISTHAQKEAPGSPAAIPTQKMVMPGTKAAAGLAARVRVMNIEEALPTTRVPALKLLRAHLSQEEIEELEKIIYGSYDDRDLDRAATSPKRAIERLIHHTNFQNLNAEFQALIFREIAQAPHDLDTIVTAHTLCDANLLQHMDAQLQRQLFEVYADLNPKTRSELALAAHRQVNGKSVLIDHDFSDTATMTHLFEIAKQKDLPSLLKKASYSKQELFGHAITRLARPAQIYAEVLGPGVLSVLEFALASYSPAEMTRYWAELIGPEMAIALPKNTSLQLHRLTNFSEVMGPMGAMLEQLLPLAHPRGTPTHEALVMPGSRCLDADVIARSLGYLYGITFRVIAEKTRVLDLVRSKRPEKNRVPPIFFTTIIDQYERLFILDHFADDLAYIRAPHGGSLKTKGSRRLDPERRVEVADLGQDIISAETLASCIGVVIAPRN
jgi:hypothetical protein